MLSNVVLQNCGTQKWKQIVGVTRKSLSVVHSTSADAVSYHMPSPTYDSLEKEDKDNLSSRRGKSRIRIHEDNVRSTKAEECPCNKRFFCSMLPPQIAKRLLNLQRLINEILAVSMQDERTAVSISTEAFSVASMIHTHCRDVMADMHALMHCDPACWSPTNLDDLTVASDTDM